MLKQTFPEIEPGRFIVVDVNDAERKTFEDALDAWDALAPSWSSPRPPFGPTHTLDFASPAAEAASVVAAS